MIEKKELSHISFCNIRRPRSRFINDPSEARALDNPRPRTEGALALAKASICKKKSEKVRSGGFTLVELLVGVSVFSIIIVSVYSAYVSIFDMVNLSRARIDAVGAINEQFEIIRNMPYAEVGISGGIPSGVLSHVKIINHGSYTYIATTTVRNFDDPFDGSALGTPRDLSPADSKLVQIDLNCLNCKKFTPVSVTTKVAPKNLETASTNGALFVRVIDASGNPVPEASIHIENNKLNPPIVIDDVTNSAGVLQIVDAPPGVNAYEITVSKSGYSTEKTYASSASNPNPVNRHATVVLQQVTQVSFIIDRVGTFDVSSVGSNCAPVGSIDFSVVSEKLIGLDPRIPKYDWNKTTNSSGLLNINNVEWGAYSFSLKDAAYEMIGMNPPLSASIDPGSIQNIQLVVAPKNPETLLVTVKDNASGLPLSGVSVRLVKTGFDSTKTTGQGFIKQTDWSGGSGQATTTDFSKYFSSDGNIDTNSPVGELRLKKLFDEYMPSGQLISSAFDAGAAINFHEIDWNPTDQPVQAGNPNVRFQIATSNDGSAWNFTGPDGTGSTYYTVANKNISSVNDNKRYIRYKVLLDSASATTTPNISDVSFTFTSSCTPPGQVYFSGLSSGSYTLYLSKEGYVSQEVSVNISSEWKSVNVSMMPE